jgi:hypothetical protein
MKRLPWILSLVLTVVAQAQTPCSPNALPKAARQALSLQKELQQIKSSDGDDEVVPAASGKITQLKEALSLATDAAMACEEPSVSAAELQLRMARVLHANQPQPAETPSDGTINHDVAGLYGTDLELKARRTPEIAGLIGIEYSIDAGCGVDTMLLIYELRDGTWEQKLRWQSPPMKMISDAFGDFFEFTVLADPSGQADGEDSWRVAVAHGTPWCTSRFSKFAIDVLAPGTSPAAPKVLWHNERYYSRGEFEPRIKSSGNTFELRVNADSMSFEEARGFERRVIYRYAVDSDGSVHRVGPMGLHARGFVEEWLEAPWSESKTFSTAYSAESLQIAHDSFDPKFRENDKEYVSHAIGPVRACKEAGVFQVQIDSTLEKIVVGKPGGESSPLPSRYFHVREVKDGYQMLSAPVAPDPTCSGPDLMPPAAE